MSGQPCPFCGAPRDGDLCPSCHRDGRARRRVCATCGQVTPVAEPVCCRCGEKARSDLRWKLPVIVLIFAAALALAILVRLGGV